MPVDYTGMPSIMSTLTELERAIPPTVQRMGDVARVFTKSIDTNFAVGGRPTWKQNAPSTKEGIPGVLQFKGKARASQKVTVTANSAEVRPDNSVYKYMAINQYGTPGGKIPPRPVYHLQEEDIEAAMEILERPIDEALRK